MPSLSASGSSLSVFSPLVTLPRQWATGMPWTFAHLQVAWPLGWKRLAHWSCGPDGEAPVPLEHVDGAGGVGTAKKSTSWVARSSSTRTLATPLRWEALLMADLMSAAVRLTASPQLAAFLGRGKA